MLSSMDKLRDRSAKLSELSRPLSEDTEQVYDNPVAGGAASFEQEHSPRSSFEEEDSSREASADGVGRSSQPVRGSSKDVYNQYLQSVDAHRDGSSPMEFEERSVKMATDAAADLAAEMAHEMRKATANTIQAFMEFSDAMSGGGHKLLDGHSLGIFSPTNPVRIALRRFIEHPAVEAFLLFLIFLNLLALAATSPGSEIDLSLIDVHGALNMTDTHDGKESAFDRTLYRFNAFCAVAFTFEAGARIIVQNCIVGEDPYLSSPWNVFEFLLIITIWVWILASLLREMDDDAGFVLSVMRTLRLMRFFVGIRELMASVAQGYKMLLTIVGLLLYTWIIGGVVGMELYAGAASRQCLEPGTAATLDLGVTQCPRTTRCELPKLCYESVPPDIQHLHVVQDRDKHLDKLGFDTIGWSFVTEFQMTIMDSWPLIAQAITESDNTNARFAWWMMLVFVCSVSLVTVNLFLASVTYSYLSVRQEARGLMMERQKKSLQQRLEDVVAQAKVADSETAYSFPMHPKYTPRCTEVANSSKFTGFMVQIVVLNVGVMMVNEYDADAGWVEYSWVIWAELFFCIM
jgi:hypothetical protein